MKFRLMQAHMTLLGAANVQWQGAESGAPKIDPKRPYGNSGRSRISRDICDLLGWEHDSGECPHCGECIEQDDVLNDAWLLHEETKDALQIILQEVARGLFPREGIWEKGDRWDSKWNYCGRGDDDEA